MPSKRPAFFKKRFNSEYYKNNNWVPPKGKTETEKINEDNDEVMNKITQATENGRAEIFTRKQLLDEPLGTCVSYITKDGLWRGGGFLVKIEKEYFVLKGGTPQNPISFSVQFKNINSMYVGANPLMKEKHVVIEETDEEPTNFPLKVGDIVVKYCRDNYDLQRRKTTHKYQAMLKQYDKEGGKEKDKKKDNKKKKDDKKYKDKMLELTAELTGRKKEDLEVPKKKSHRKEIKSKIKSYIQELEEIERRSTYLTNEIIALKKLI